MKHTVLIWIAIVFCVWVVGLEGIGSITWVNPIVLGQGSLSSGGNGLNATSMYNPNTVSYVNGNLVVNDFANRRVLVFSSTAGIATGAAASLAINARDLNTAGYQTGGASTYSSGMTNYIWVSDYNAQSFHRYTSPFSNSQPVDTNLTGSFNNPLTIAVDEERGFLYTVDSGFHRVFQYSLLNLNTPTRIYGQNSTRGTSYNKGQDLPDATTLYNPSKVVIGCSGDILIVDSFNNRILHYPLNSAQADLVLGQSNFVSNALGSSNSSLRRPFGATFNSDCSVLYVADTSNNRILQFSSPYTNGMVATATVGSAGISGSQFSAPSDVTFEPSPTPRLWVADSFNNRVLGAYLVSTPITNTTSTTTTSGSASTISSFLTTLLCYFN